MNKEKLRLLASVACFLFALILFTGVSFAYFSDSQQIANTLTAGNVTIELSEAAVKNDGGHLVEDPDKDRIMGGSDIVMNNYGKVYPGMTIYKDPTIKNTGDDAAWVAAKITITDGSGSLYNLIGYDHYAGIDMKELLFGGLVGESAHSGTWNGIPNVRYTDEWAIIQKADMDTDTYEFYVLILNPLPKDESVTLFTHFQMPPEWTSDDVKNMSQLTIHVQAYAVQLFDMTSCYQAMTTAFSDHFSF